VKSKAEVPGAFWTAVLIFAATLLAYLPAMRGGMVWDDDAHITRPDLRSVHGLERIWFEVGATQQYYPVLHSAFWVEHRLWGDATLGYHLLNVLLHAAAACLFVTLLRRLFRAPANSAFFDAPLFGGLIFALHPVCVESVAWISEQKNTLSAVFYLLSALTYLRWWEGQPADELEVGPGGRARPLAPSTFDVSSNERSGATTRPYLYFLASGFFALALLSKSVTATLPAALLVVSWWKRGRLSWKEDIVPLLPWLALGLSAGLFTAWVERRFVGAQGAAYELGGWQRCLVAGRVIWFYLGKLFWPTNLVFIYPRWTVSAAVAWQFTFPLAALLVLALLWQWRRRSRGPLAAALFFVGSLFPALGFFDAYPFRYSFVADHFQYLASLGIIALTASAWALWRARPLALAAAAALLLVLGVLTWRQCGDYRDLVTLYRATIAKNPDCWMAYSNLGTELLDSGHTPEAIDDLSQAVRLKPDLPDIQFDLANALLAEGNNQAAVPHYQEALRLQPDYPEAHDNFGTALLRLGRLGDAIAQYGEALRLRPNYPRARLNLSMAENSLGLTLGESGHPQDALAHFERALQLRPDYREARYNLSIALRDLGRTQEALEQYHRAVEPPGAR
jgi:protein O-mannosyl-transferase